MVLVLSLIGAKSRLPPLLDAAALGGGSTSRRGRGVGLAGNDAVVTTAAAIAAGATAITASATRATAAAVV